MYVKLIPVALRFSALVTVELTIPVIVPSVTIKKVLFKRDLWAYEAPTISAKIVDTRKKEKDNSPPEIKEFVDDPSKVIHLLNYNCHTLLYVILLLIAIQKISF